MNISIICVISKLKQAHNIHNSIEYNGFPAILIYFYSLLNKNTIVSI